MTDIWRPDAPNADAELFGSSAWAHVLEGLGCRVETMRNLGLGVDVVVPIFRRGPLRIGFLGFPVSGRGFDRMTAPEFDHHCKSLASALDLDIVRGTRSGLEAPQPGHCLPEVWTDDLDQWPGSQRKRLAKDVAFARRACDGLRVQGQGGDPAAWYRLYAATVRAHRGNLRYTEDYFRRLQAAAGRGAPLRVLQAEGRDGRVVGFAVLAINGDTGFYLHGGVDESARRTGLSDLLLWELMGYAKDHGVRRFTLMASPAAQEGLIRFKQKWADRQGFSATRDVGRGPLGRWALSLYGRLHDWRRHFSRTPA